MTIYVNSPAALRPHLELQESGITYKMPDESKANVEGFKGRFKHVEPTDQPEKIATIVVAEMSSHVTEEVEDFQRPTFAVVPGRFDREAGENMADFWNRIEIITPWVRAVIGPAVVMRNPMGEMVEVKATISKTIEEPEPVALPSIETLMNPKAMKGKEARTRMEAFDMRMGMVAMVGSGARQIVTNIAISTNQSKEDAMRAVFAATWAVLERAAIDAYGMEWANAISASLDEGQKFIMAEGKTEEKRRKDAFVAFAMNAENGAAMSANDESAYCFVVFQAAYDGVLGKQLMAHHNPY